MKLVIENEYDWHVDGENGERMSEGGFYTLESRFGGSVLRTLAVGGVATPPEYRRLGCVRMMFEHALEIAPERGWAQAVLHPFSFTYYRKFGFERVADHLVIEFPMSALSHLPRVSELVPLTPERLPDALEIYEAFSRDRNFMFPRRDDEKFRSSFQGGDCKTYIWYDGGRPAAYVTFRGENYYSVNRMVSVNLHVYELAFTSPASLTAALGFLRMFEGEFETVKIHNAAMSPEVDLALRHYMHTKYTVIPDLMVRIFDTEALLRANHYPIAPGRFTLEILDELPLVRGVWEVAYADGRATEIVRDRPGARPELTADVRAAAQLLYGYGAGNAATAAYMENVTVHAAAEDFFRAFPHRPAGLFEHF